LDNIVQENKFIFIDADTWIQDSDCFSELSTLADTKGFAACYTKRVGGSGFHNLKCTPPKNALQKDMLNSGVMAFNSQKDLFVKTREYFRHKECIAPMVEQVCFEFATYDLGLNSSIDFKYNYLVGWGKNTALELKKDGFYANNTRLSIIHNLLSAYKKAQVVHINQQPIRMPILPDIAKTYALVS